MAKMRIYSEISFKVSLPLKDVDVSTPDYDVQRHRKEVHEYLQKKLAAAFSDAEDMTLHYFEFSAGKD